VFEWSADRMQILPILCTYVAMATHFCLLMGYNFGCIIASDTLFDYSGGFRGQAIR